MHLGSCGGRNEQAVQACSSQAASAGPLHGGRAATSIPCYGMACQLAACSGADSSRCCSSVLCVSCGVLSGPECQGHLLPPLLCM